MMKNKFEQIKMRSNKLSLSFKLSFVTFAKKISIANFSNWSKIKNTDIKTKNKNFKTNNFDKQHLKKKFIFKKFFELIRNYLTVMFDFFESKKNYFYIRLRSQFFHIFFSKGIFFSMHIKKEIEKFFHSFFANHHKFHYLKR